MTLPGWHEVDDLLGELQAPVSAAESHGILCGLVATHARDARATWIRRSLDEEAVPEAVPEPLSRVHDESVRQLDDATFDFQLLLPADDERDLETRTAALAEWCNGFAFGVGASGWREDDLPAESREFLHDVARIAQAEVQGSEDDEAAFAEVVEYVRMGVLLTRTECGGGTAPAGA